MAEVMFMKPLKGDPYFNTRSVGGYSTAIVGRPTQDGLNVLSNCVGYAVGMFHKMADCPQFNLVDPVNAEDIYENAIKHGLSVGKEPRVNAMIVWEGLGSAAGHVAFVDRVNADGSIETSESGWNCTNPYWVTKRYNTDGNWQGGSGYRLKGFVYQPSNVPRKYIQRGMVGNDVRTMQTKLCAAGYLRASEIDGDFGNITFGAVLAFQYDNDLEVDGSCGPLTQQALGMIA